MAPTPCERAVAADPAPRPPAGAAFLISQLGPRSADLFAERVGALGLTPPLVGLLRAIDRAPGRSQQAIAAELGIRAPKLVALLDQLAELDLIERRAGTRDRRQHAVHVSARGREVLDAELRQASRDHEEALVGTLDSDERAELVRLLRRVADAQGLTPEVHPGYRAL